MKRVNFKGFLCGVLVTTIIGTSVNIIARAEPVKRQLNAVYNNIKIMVNGVTITPKDINGCEVEPFVIKGTTYLPVRAVSEVLGAEVKWDEKKQIVNIDTDIKIIASIPEERIYLYALNKQDDMYKNLVLSVNGVKKVFGWETISIISDLPQLYYIDLNGDNKKELVIILSEGRGTGFASYKAHIINPEDLTEYKIEDPLDIIEGNVETKILSPKEVEIKINNTISNIKTPNDFPDISEIYYKNYISYDITTDNILRVRVGVEVEPLIYIGNIIIDYSFEDDEFKFNKILFEN